MIVMDSDEASVPSDEPAQGISLLERTRARHAASSSDAFGVQDEAQCSYVEEAAVGGISLQGES